MIHSQPSLRWLVFGGKSIAEAARKQEVSDCTAAEKQAQMGAGDHVAKLKAELNLTAEQTAQVETIFADSKMQPLQARMGAAHAQLQALRSASPSDTAAIAAKESELGTIRDERRALLAERDSTMQKILTPVQFAKFQELAAGHGSGMGAGHPHSK